MKSSFSPTLLPLIFRPQPTLFTTTTMPIPHAQLLVRIIDNKATGVTITLSSIIALVIVKGQDHISENVSSVTLKVTVHDDANNFKDCNTMRAHQISIHSNHGNRGQMLRWTHLTLQQTGLLTLERHTTSLQTSTILPYINHIMEVMMYSLQMVRLYRSHTPVPLFSQLLLVN